MLGMDLQIMGNWSQMVLKGSSLGFLSEAMWKSE